MRGGGGISGDGGGPEIRLWRWGKISGGQEVDEGGVACLHCITEGAADGRLGGGEETKVIVHKAFSRRDRSEAAAALEINT